MIALKKIELVGKRPPVPELKADPVKIHHTLKRARELRTVKVKQSRLP